MNKINQSHEKEIVALNTFEAVRLRPTMYLGQISPIEDKIPIIKDNTLIIEEKKWSPGFMHLIVEILENAIDEAKRMKGKMKSINVTVNTKNNEISITDLGQGFHKAASKHPKTKKSVVRTAFEELHAGSNFTDTDNNILGTHGVGSSVVNILCKNFEVITTNKTHTVHVKWDDFKVIEENKYLNKNQKPQPILGTTVKFIPSPSVFPRYKWDIEILQTYFSFKQFLISNDSIIKNLKLDIKIDGKNCPIYTDFVPNNAIKIFKDKGTIFLWPKYENSTSIGFINGSLSSGVHQKIVNDWCNEYFDYPYAHHFYDTLVSMNIPSKLMRFADQNKTKYAGTRSEIEGIMIANFKGKLIRDLKNSVISKDIIKKIEERTYNENIKKIKKAQRTSKRKISEKYSPATKSKDVLYITEGLSAAGSVRQARNSETEGVYSLKGKIKNTKRLSDLTDNTEILEIMSILGIEPSSKNPPTYKKIVIACDEDFDGHHISSLIINFFYKWFPHIIQDCRLYKLITPLVVYHMKSTDRYFYSLEEFYEYSKGQKLSNVTYLKGLGSLSLKDWENVMNNKVLFKIVKDQKSEKYLDIAFGDSTLKRKMWLSNSNL